MKRSENMVLRLCILLLLVFTAGIATAEDGNMTVTDNVSDNVTDDNITVNLSDNTDNNTGNVSENADSGNETEDANQTTDEVDAGEIADDIEPYDGSIGPGNALYGLKIAFENVNVELFTFNETEKLGKQVSRARLRIAEAKAELRNNNQEAANRALELYDEQIESANESAEQLSGNESGMINAQERMVEHQIVLKRLLDANPNSTGLQRAYNNSLKLEEKFELKTQVKLERTLTRENRIVLKAVKKERHEEKEEIELKAEIHGNTTKVKVKVEFLSNSTDNETIAQEILDRMKMDPDTISGILKVETDEDEDEESEETEEKLEAKAETEWGGMDVEAEYEFGLNTTDENEIKDSIHRKLSALEPDDILDVLEIEIESEDMDEIKEERIEIRDERKEERENERESRREERDENSDSD